jgi:hypothetical protein
MTRDLEVEVLCASRPLRALAKRKGVIVRWGPEEAWSKATSRRTGTGYKAWWVGASELKIAKLHGPKGHCVDPAVVRRRSRSLTWGDLALCLKGRRREAEREVSRGRSSQPETAESLIAALMKVRTEGRAKPL